MNTFIIKDIQQIIGTYVPSEFVSYIAAYDESFEWKLFYKTLFNETDIIIPYTYPINCTNVWLNAIINHFRFYNNSIACGGFHTSVLLKEGMIINSDNNGYYQFGISNNNHTNDFTIIESIIDVVQIACGGFHTTVLLKDGTIMSSGDNSSGQLSLGNK